MQQASTEVIDDGVDKDYMRKLAKKEGGSYSLLGRLFGKKLTPEEKAQRKLAKEQKKQRQKDPYEDRRKEMAAKEKTLVCTMLPHGGEECDFV